MVALPAWCHAAPTSSRASAPSLRSGTPPVMWEVLWRVVCRKPTA